jgi:peptidoglycan/LPS O-acetylase OafA/YrhL
MKHDPGEVAGAVYFPNLNALRFFAAFLVFLGHLEWTRVVAGHPSRISQSAFIQNSGSLGVNLFFTLSGFLITYLLLAEYAKQGTINVGRFYCRRILRIWPLYYLTVLLGFSVLPHFLAIPSLVQVLSGKYYWAKLTLFLAMMPNVAYVSFPIVPFASQLWTVGVEEQFYAVWPWLVRFFSRSMMPTLVVVVLLVVCARLYVEHQYTAYPTRGWYIASQLLFYLRIQCMAFGAMGAWLVHQGRHWILKFIFLKWVQIIVLCGAFALHVFYTSLFGRFQFDVVAILHAIIITNAAANSGNILHLENSVTNYLGRISYGIYIYQILALRLALIFVTHYLGFSSRFVSPLVYALLSAAFTLVLAGASYRFFELPFLRLKPRYSTVLSQVQPPGRTV